MTPTLYRFCLDTLNLSQRAAGRLLGVGERTSRRWALGEARVHMTAAILLRLLAKGRVSLSDVKEASLFTSD